MIGWARICITFSLATSYSLLATTAEAESAEVEVLAKGSRAVPIDRPNPKYPSDAAIKGIEGYVVVSFIVQDDGSVSEIKILDAVPKGYFEKHATRSVRKWKYKPATQNGKPIVQAKTKVLLSFQLEGRPIGASGRFIKHYKRSFNALEAGDLDLARSEFAEIEKKQLKGLYEVYYLHLLKAHIKIKEGNLRWAIWHLIKATRSSNGAIEEQSYLQALRLLYALQIEENQLVEALSTFEQLNNSDSLKTNDPLLKHAEEVIAALDSNSPLVAAGNLDELCSECDEPDIFQWNYTLYRDAFTIREVTGHIERFELYCGYHWAKVRFEPDTLWKLNESWGDCDVYVYGKSATTFKLVEEWKNPDNKTQ